jgi:hypothetical protein
VSLFDCDIQSIVMNDIERQVAHLRALSQEPPNPERRAEVMSALANKWEGVQSVALDALGRWGGHESGIALRAFLEQAFKREAGWAIRGVAIRGLARLVTAEDVDWVLDLYFGPITALEKHELLPVVLSLPAQPARARLVSELGSLHPTNRQAAVKAIGNMPYPDRRMLVRTLLHDPNPSVTSSAKLLSQDRERT